MFLQTSDPIRVEDIQRLLPPNVKAEIVQGVLDVLVVMGIVVRLHETEGVASTSKSSTLQTLLKEKKRQAVPYYMLNKFCRCSEGVDIQRLPELLESKRASIAALKARVSALQSLTEAPLEPAERLRRLREIITSSVSGNKSLQHDPLYIALESHSPRPAPE